MKATLSRPRVTVVVPCFNEEAVLGETSRRLKELLDRLAADGRVAESSGVLFVDDGSRDRTWLLIMELSRLDGSRVGGLKLSRNRGHQAALLAGLLNAPGDILVSVDADLQDDLDAIPNMLDAWAGGSDIVYGVRSRRDSDTKFKRMTAEAYYRILDKMGVEIVFNHADYRLMSRRAIEALRGFGESNLFLRGIIPQLGFPTSIVQYERHERFAGESKYPLGKMLALAWQGITSFSATPLRVITAIGITVSIASLALGFWALWIRLFTSDAVPGWASVVVPLFLLSGVQLLSLGIIGEYLAKVYLETKARPRFFVEELIEPGIGTNLPAQEVRSSQGATDRIRV